MFIVYYHQHSRYAGAPHPTGYRGRLPRWIKWPILMTFKNSEHLFRKMSQSQTLFLSKIVSILLVHATWSLGHFMVPLLVYNKYLSYNIVHTSKNCSVVAPWSFCLLNYSAVSVGRCNMYKTLVSKSAQCPKIRKIV